MTAKRPLRRRRRWVARTASGVTLILLAAGCVAVHPTVRDAQWHLRFLRIAEAHELSRGAGVTVAVIDTGVDAGHPDLAGSILPGRDFTTAADDGSAGRTDVDGHGTSMAGLIAAHGRVLGGAQGVAPEALILPVRDQIDGDAYEGDTAAQITWAVAHGAKVINMSFGSEGPDADVRAAVDAALRADVVLVASVGNRPDDREVLYPAAYPGVIAVSAVDRSGMIAPVSVTGAAVVLAAPGQDVMSTDIRTDGHVGYDAGSGTSNSSAIVAGVAALIRAKFPTMSASDVVKRLTATATDYGPPGRDPAYGYGIVNPVEALTSNAAGSPDAPRAVRPAGATPPGPGHWNNG